MGTCPIAAQLAMPMSALQSLKLVKVVDLISLVSVLVCRPISVQTVKMLMQLSILSKVRTIIIIIQHILFPSQYGNNRHI